jgi:uncharacterized repeat protein (TIGR03806 family)
MNNQRIYVLTAVSIFGMSACGNEEPTLDSSITEQPVVQAAAIETEDEFEKPYLRNLDPNNPNPNNPLCNKSTDLTEVNWEAVLADVSYSQNCEKLSDYNFFTDPTNPTTGLNGKGALYEMNTELFTDYASKYRFVVMPNEAMAKYRQHETFEFAIGTVLIKSFALPSTTQNRGFENEELIETRLLIKRKAGWVALPYVWNEDYSDAQLIGAPINLKRSITHKNKLISFNYGIPGRDQCTTCHNVQTEISVASNENVQPAGFLPIGPKARHINRDINHSGNAINQLDLWRQLNLIEGLPNDPDTIEQMPQFDSDIGFDASSASYTEIENYAKAYLDINCAHCHREEGKAKSTGMYVPYWLPYQGENKKVHGECRTTLTAAKLPTVIDIVPGDANASLLHYRMAIIGGEMMPELGRDTVHKEGLQLIEDWINAMDVVDCGG